MKKTKKQTLFAMISENSKLMEYIFFKQKIVVGSILRIITKESEMHCFSEYN